MMQVQLQYASPVYVPCMQICEPGQARGARREPRHRRVGGVQPGHRSGQGRGQEEAGLGGKVRPWLLNSCEPPLAGSVSSLLTIGVQSVPC